jgi:histidinol-phosphate aminotransferase
MRVSKRLAGQEAYNPGGRPCKVVLNANESFIPPSAELLAQFHKVVDETAFNRYPDPRAKKLCQAFAGLYGLDWENVTAFNGSDESIDLLYACLVAPGDNVVTVSPDFSMYGFGAFMNEVHEFVYEKDDFRIDVDALLAFAKEKDAALIVFSNPCNPTGIALPRQEVIRLIEGFDGIVVVDEAYMDFGHDSILDLAGKKENLVVLKTCSKALAMASLRLGFAITTKELTNYFQVGKAPYNVGRLVQALGTCVLERHDEIRGNIQRIVESTRALEAGLNALCDKYELITRVLPTSSNYCYVLSPRARELYEHMQDHDVLVRTYSSGDALRICSGTEEENAACLAALEASVRELQA